MIKDISGIPLLILIGATIIDCLIIAVAFKSFITNGKKDC